MLVVEPARDADAQSVAQLASEAMQVDPAWRQDPSPCCMVARELQTDEIVGFAVAHREEPCSGHLLALAVARTRRGEGIGSALLTKVREQMLREGAMRLDLEVRASNQQAQEFYGRHGFHPEGLESHAYPDGEDAVRLTLPI